jgi:uncharacterized FAD-dependent dehydrogenase
MIRIEEIRRPFTEPSGKLIGIIAGALTLSVTQLLEFRISKRAVDARKKMIYFVYSVDFRLDEASEKIDWNKLPSGWRVREIAPYQYRIPDSLPCSKTPPAIVGTGPCGLFAGLVLAEAGLNPIILERGKPVDQRVHDVNILMQNGKLNPESNIQFGEGGAGTFSDGKLYTLIHDPRTRFIFDRLVEAGAPPEILQEAKPHIGTDRLIQVVRTLRETIIGLGGQVRFQSKMTGCRIRQNRISAIEVNHQEILPVSALILAIGHSARDTMEMLFDSGLQMQAKGFSMGIRIEHLAEWISKFQYGSYWNDRRLPAAKYKLAVHLPGKRSVYTFCMCPGGVVVPAASEPEGVVTNGMSEYAQNGINSNSALLVNVFPADCGKHPLAGMTFQQKWERKAYQSGGGDFTAPVQLLGDFLKNRVSDRFKKVFPTYRPDTQFTDLNTCLPLFIAEHLKTALPALNTRIKGFSHPDAVLTAVESRSSSPVRILRNDSLQSNIQGLYPAGEGAGYAGGIVSSAVDGIRIAEAIMAAQ